MITVIAKLTAAEGKEAEMRTALEHMVAEVSAKEPGVTAYSLHQADNDPAVFYFYEQYADADAVAAHGQTEHMKAFGASLREIAGGRPEIIRMTQIAGVSR